MTTLVQVAQFLAATPAPTDPAGVTPTSVNFDGIKQFLVFGIVPVLGIITGIIIWMRARTGNMGQAVTTSGISVLGMIFIGASALWAGVGLTTSGILFK